MRFKPRSVYDVLALVSFFLVLGGGTALASYVVSSNSQVGPNTISGNHVSTGKHPNLIAGSVGSKDVADDNLTGADIRNQSGVDTCTHGTVRLGELCFRASNSAPQTWNQAVGDCEGRGLRLPSFAEAVTLATQYDLPNLNDQELFWTGEYYAATSGPRSLGVSDGGGYLDSDQQSTYRTVCVTTPTN